MAMGDERAIDGAGGIDPGVGGADIEAVGVRLDPGDHGGDYARR
jgi:hypothetical protein